MVSRKSAVKSIPIAKSYFNRKEFALVSTTIASGWISQGRMVEEFESALSRYTGAKYAIAVSSGTTALHLALLLSGVGPDDEVIIPSFSFIATANAVLYCGAKPVFVDIDPRTYNIDPVKISKFLDECCKFDRVKCRVINRNTGRVIKAIMPVHQFGLSADLDAIGKIAKRYCLAVVEDAACGLGSLYKGRKIGDGHNISCFSFHPRKIITTGEGGAILTDNKSYADRLHILRNHGASLTARDKHTGKAAAKEDYEVLGYNYRMTDIQAAVGIAQMLKLPAILKKRNYLAKNYNDAFKNIGYVHVPYIPEYATPNYQSYILRIDDGAPVSRDDIVRELLKYGISARRGNTAIHTQTLYKNMGPGPDLENTERAASHTIALPLYFDMTIKEQDFIIDTLVSIIRK